jgi:two-component system cell cycle response regulator DivK
VEPLVLVVDDYADSRELLAMALREAGCAVVEAADGAAALELTWQVVPDIVLMDLSMPGLDGCGATLALKSDPRSKHVPVVAVTCHDRGEVEARIRGVPFDGVVTKPCLPEDVAALALRILHRRDSA